MIRLAVSALAVLALHPVSARAVIVQPVDDPQGENKALTEQARNDPRGQDLVRDLGEFGRRLTSIAARSPDGILPVGRKVPAPGPDFALPAAETRDMIVVSGMHEPGMFRGGNDTYLIGDAGAVRIYRSASGHPCLTLVYLRVDDQFVGLGRQTSERAISRRLAWDFSRFNRLRRLVLTELGEYTDWRLDPNGPVGMSFPSEAALPYPSMRLAAEWARIVPNELTGGTEIGLWKTYVRRWKDEKGRLIREVRYVNAKSEDDLGFAEELTEWFPDVGVRRRFDARASRVTWQQDSGGMIREEFGRFRDSGRWRTNHWVWYGPDGTKLRIELDRNDDGIPDALGAADESNPVPLDVADSWAIHPERIPASCRVPDQDAWRVGIIPIDYDELLAQDGPWIPRGVLWAAGGVGAVLAAWQLARVVNARRWLARGLES